MDFEVGMFEHGNFLVISLWSNPAKMLAAKTLHIFTLCAHIIIDNEVVHVLENPFSLESQDLILILI